MDATSLPAHMVCACTPLSMTPLFMSSLISLIMCLGQRASWVSVRVTGRRSTSGCSSMALLFYTVPTSSWWGSTARGPSFTLIDVKTFDPSASSIVDHHHTSVTPRARHRELERRDTPRQYFGVARPPPAMRLVTFVVSVFCSFGEQAQALLRSLSMRCGRSVPPTLIEESSWATPLFAPFARMSISLACRRALAAALRESVVSDPRRVAPAAPGPSDPSRSFQCACHAGVPV